MTMIAQTGLETGTMSRRTRIENELHELRERLAEAWWNEAPLPEIQRLEYRIEECKRELHGHNEVAC